jgi:hypothetical protein
MVLGIIHVLLIDIIESLNYETSIVWNDDVGTFTVGDQKFTVTVRKATPQEQRTFVPFFETQPTVGNVDFSVFLPTGKTTQDLTSTSGNTAMKVFSVVAQAVKEQISKHNFDIVLCVAKRTSSPTKYQNRVDAYETIVDRAARKSGMVSTKIFSTNNETIYVVFKHEFTDNINKVKQHLLKS